MKAYMFFRCEAAAGNNGSRVEGSSARPSRIKLCSLGVAALAIVGCWSSTPYPLTQVEGNVLYEDGSLIPAETVRLQFISLAETKSPKYPPKKANVQVDATTGRLTKATTYRYGDGVIRGEHRVIVQAMNGGRPDVGLVPSSCERPDTTPLMVDTAVQPIEIRVPKP